MTVFSFGGGVMASSMGDRGVSTVVDGPFDGINELRSFAAGPPEPPTPSRRPVWLALVLSSLSPP